VRWQLAYKAFPFFILNLQLQQALE
jgi:hypothetical protein